MCNHMLTGEQERELLDSVHIQEEDSWLMLLYSTMCKKVSPCVSRLEACRVPLLTCTTADEAEFVVRPAQVGTSCLPMPSHICVLCTGHSCLGRSLEPTHCKSHC